ncbi:sulfatase family protein [Halobacterium rubrum]|uniref:sulfatase family protein n=1 Tax=Halobacterium TaxID=2239 RepID=UPI001EFFE68B|nr:MULTISPECIES: sulfatase-like hydrolase/transferase [Halobacterium]MDH5019261.1 sulfatase-like hydrolase/transferase [Halobacterium rubrum]
MTASDTPTNLLVLCVDCLRDDAVRSDRTDTPFLDSLRAGGLDCSNVYSSTTTTTPAMASLLTGTYNERNGVMSLRRGTLSDDVDPLGTVLGDAGYHTEARVTGPLLPETGLDRGFDVYEHRAEDADLFRGWKPEILDRLDAMPEPFGAFVHLWELHEDVHVPAEFDSPEYGATPYGRALSALDRDLADLVDAVPDDTVVAFLGDHGESVTFRNSPLRLVLKSLRDAAQYYGGVDLRAPVAALNRRWDGRGPDVDDHYLENGHGENVYDFTTNVPFVLSGPGVESGSVDAQLRQVDVLPTLLDALGVDERPANDVDGEPVTAATSDDRPAYLRACGASLHRERNWARAVRADGYKYVTYPDRDWDAELYDLESDPRELRRIEDSEVEARMERLLPERGQPLEQVEELDIDDHLEDLGYL